MNSFLRILLASLTTLAAFGLAVATVVIGAYYYVEPSLPKVEELRDVRLQVPLRVYSRDGRLMNEFGEQRRTPVAYHAIPDRMIQALLAAEDDSFFQHVGLDFVSTARAGLNYFITPSSDRVAGGSTITQQLARDYFLSREYSPVRKFKELILAIRIEREFTKEEILELFFNRMFFGQHSYGIATAAQTYFDKSLSELTLSDTAILVGLLQGPSIMNPVSSPSRAEARRAYVLRRMRELNMIRADEYEEALAEPVVAKRYALPIQLDAPYVAEMARAEMVRRFGPAAYTAGLKVTTTVDSRLQAAANRSIRQALIAYDERHGYRGPLARVDLTQVSDRADSGAPPVATPGGPAANADAAEKWRELLGDYPPQLGFEAGLVLSSDESSARVYLASRGEKTIGLDAMRWAGRYINEHRKGAAPKTVSEVLQAGDIVRFRLDDEGNLRLAQIPEVEGAFVAVDPQDGAIVALAGGFDFRLSSYNRATQPKRQPGSSFKPFIWSAALEYGFTPASVVNDNPLQFNYDAALERAWKPENYDGRFHGDTRLREALNGSMNWVSIRIVNQIGVRTARQHLRQFGFEDVALPNDPTIALGTGGIPPVDLASALATFANGGFRVQQYFVQRVEDSTGEVLYEAKPAFACADCVEQALEADERPALPESGTASDLDAELELIDDITEVYPPMRLAPRAISPQNAYLVADMMQDVVRRGTGAAAYNALRRNDLAGKTGTTNDEADAWFVGFNADIVGTAWVGFDDPQRTLGRGEQGSRTAIPMWVGFMAEALSGRPERPVERPPGIVEYRINPLTGKLANDTTPNSIIEKFQFGNVPEREAQVFPGRVDPDVPVGEQPSRSDRIFQ